MHTAKEYSMGLTLQFPDLPIIEKRERHTAVGRVPEKRQNTLSRNGKDQMAPLIESDDNGNCSGNWHRLSVISQVQAR